MGKMKETMSSQDYVPLQQAIPSCFLAKCEGRFPGCQIDVDTRKAFHPVWGLERPREAGGTNALTARKPDLTRFYCDLCAEKLQRGQAGQMSML